MTSIDKEGEMGSYLASLFGMIISALGALALFRTIDHMDSH